MIQIVNKKARKPVRKLSLANDCETDCENDPTIEEIELITAEIRRGWSDRVRESRSVSKRSMFVKKQVSVDEWVASIRSAFRS